MSRNPKISIIIPVYNAELYLKDCLDSIVNQTYAKNIELIIVNDGSTDSSQSIIDSFKNNYKNIKVLKQKNQGVIKARINGYKMATGDYVAWMDNDDLASLDMYEKLHRKAIEEKSDVVICDYTFMPSAIWNKRKWFNTYTGVVDWRFVNHNTVLWNKLIKKSYIDDIDFIQLMLDMGEAAFTLLLIKTKAISTINLALYRYRVGHGSQSSYSNVEWYIHNLNLAIRRRDSVIGTPLENEWLDYLDALVFNSYIQVLVVCAYNRRSSEYQKFKKLFDAHRPSARRLGNLVMRINNGTMRYLVLRFIVPNSYWTTKLITRVLL